MNPAMPTQQAFCYNCHAPLVSPGTAFCDTCGAPQRSFAALSQVKALEEQKNILESQIQKLLELETQRNITLQAVENKRAVLLAEIKEFENKKVELTNEVEALTSQKQQLEIKRGARKSGPRPHIREARTVRKELRGGIKRGTHTFIGKYEGRGDWNAELAKLIAQFELSLDTTRYSVSPEKISFSVTGSRDNIEKLAAALNRLEGYVNLRSKLAETKRNLRETIDARNDRKEQLDELSRAPWYSGKSVKSLNMQKAQLSQELVADGLRIKALVEAKKALESLIGLRGD